MELLKTLNGCNVMRAEYVERLQGDISWTLQFSLNHLVPYATSWTQVDDTYRMKSSLALLSILSRDRTLGVILLDKTPVSETILRAYRLPSSEME